MNRFPPAFDSCTRTPPGGQLSRGSFAMETECHDSTLDGPALLLDSRTDVSQRGGSPLAVAGYKEIYDVAQVERALREEARAESLKAFHGKMKHLGGLRYLIKPTTLAALDALYESSPNFAPVIDDIKKQTLLALAGGEPVSFTPMLLLGDPGLGKTHFAKSMAPILGVAFEFVSMCSLTAGWILSGASCRWSNGRPGKGGEAWLNCVF